jgi:hypothetical protein
MRPLSLILILVVFVFSNPSDSIKAVFPAIGQVTVDTSKTTEVTPKKPTNWSKIKDLFL